MSRRLVVHIASGLGIVSLAVFFLGLIPFLSIDPSAGAGLLRRTPALSVNREFKGDRLPIAPVSAASRRAIQLHLPALHDLIVGSTNCICRGSIVILARKTFDSKALAGPNNK
jgi:hypothetical protein